MYQLAMPTALPSMAHEGLDQPYSSLPKQEPYMFAFPPLMAHPPRDQFPNNPNAQSRSTEGLFTNNPGSFPILNSSANTTQQSQADSNNMPSREQETHMMVAARRMSADQGYSHLAHTPSNQRFGESFPEASYPGPTQSDLVPNLSQLPGMSKAKLVFEGDIQEIPNNWSEEERLNRRRLVQFWRKHDNNSIQCKFSVVPPSTRPPNSIVISCIYWEEREQFFITSVDCIHLLESLISVRFTVEEKNRIRRNLEGFRPLTVSKCKQDTAEFFKLIMAFPNPKPRNIEKDVKVFPWRVLQHALMKIVSKYATGFASALPKYEMPSYPMSSYGYQASGYQRRYSQPANMGMYNHPYFAPPMSQMPAIPERPQIDQFPRRHSMSDPYSVQRMQPRGSISSLSRVEEDVKDYSSYGYRTQPTGLGIAEGYGPPTTNDTNNPPSQSENQQAGQPSYQSNQHLGQQQQQQAPGFYYPIRE